MANETENLDSKNEEKDIEETEESEEEPEESEDVNVLKERNEKLSEKNKTLFGRAKKSEGEVKILKEQLKKFTEKPPKENLEKSQSNEPDYSKMAFLETRGFTNPDDQKWIQDEASRLKLPLTDILAMEHAKSHLQASKDQREAQAGAPKGGGRGSSKTQQDVDYWVDKKKSDGSYDTPDDVELAGKVIEARIHKEQNANKFSDELYNG